MRLLNVQSMKLEEYFGSQIPRYAILSHCWGSGEVTFEDINRPSWHEKEGAKKVKLATQQAKKEGLEHIWIDTCCIDKSSSAELSEAINSMYAWYEHAVVCFAYLEDIIFEDIENSKWFTRGWTLQEMVAPTNIMFFDKRWILLGTKIELVGHLSRITSISEDVLLDPSRRHNSSVARKMSWASTRETTRMEDMAYSLLGIFNVNMPLLYGEGKRAFARLQEEILKETDDHSLFAWIIYPTSNRNNPDLENACGSVPSAPNSEQSFLSILAESPANFRYTGKVVPYPSGSRSHPCSMTSRGLSIDVRLRGDIAALECHQENDLSSSIGIDIVYVGNENVYRRVLGSGLKTVSAAQLEGMKTEPLFILKNPPRRVPKKIYRIDLTTDQHFGHTAEIDLLAPTDCLWRAETRILQISAEKNPGQTHVSFAIRSHKSKVAFLVNHSSETNEDPKDRQLQQDARISLKPDEMGVKDWMENFTPRQGNIPGEVLHNLRTQVLVSGEKHTLDIHAHVERETILNQQVTVLKVTVSMEKPTLVSLFGRVRKWPTDS